MQDNAAETDIRKRVFSPLEITDMFGWPQPSLQSDLKRHLPATMFTGGGSRGHRRKVNFDGIMTLAIAQKLRRNQYASNAYHLAKLAVAGHGRPGDENWKELGFPYHYNMGETMFCESDGKWTVTCAHFDTDSVDDNLRKIFQKLGKPALGSLGVTDVLIIDITAVFREVCGVLGLDWRDVLDVVYPEEVRA